MIFSNPAGRGMRHPVQQRVARLRQQVAGNAIARAHVLDLFVALLSRRSKMFSPGWGDEHFLARLHGLVSRTDRPGQISLSWTAVDQRNGILRRDGAFPSPLVTLPAEARVVHVRSCIREGNRSACVILAGSHDEGYRVRERVFGALVGRGIDLYFLENPYYGFRRIPGGIPAIKVSDQAMMALGIVLEARDLLAFLRPQYERLGVAGYSMGGHMAALTAAVTPFPVACAALATGASASSIYTRGLMSWCIDFDRLAEGPAQRASAQRRLHSFFDAADISNYPAPLRVDAAVILGCTRDGYVLRSETERLHRYWAGSTLRWLSAGHFSALLTSRRALCNCLSDAIDKL
jgi:pimeloyl-ACP methyl ester carboxylesterase